MSLIISVYVPTGIALSGDSRTTGTITQVQAAGPPAGTAGPPLVTNVVLSDAAEKVFLVHGRVGIGTFGDAVVNNMPIAHYVQQFTSTQSPSPTQTPTAFARALLQHFRALTPLPNVGFVVVGYDATDPYVLGVDVQQNTATRVNLVAGTTQVDYGIVRGGDAAVVNRLLSQQQFNPLFNVMNLQDAVDFSRHLIRSTIDQMRFEPRFSTVGGLIDTLVATPAGARFLAHKELVCT